MYLTTVCCYCTSSQVEPVSVAQGQKLWYLIPGKHLFFRFKEPNCSVLFLNELDKELESRGHRFVRYADDALIFCKSRRSAERTLANIIPFIEGKLFLKVNRAKTTVTHVSKIKYLGYAFYRNKGKCRFRVHPKNVQKMKDRLR